MVLEDSVRAILQEEWMFMPHKLKELRGALIACTLLILGVPAMSCAQPPRVKPVQQLVIEDRAGKTVARVIGGISVSNIQDEVNINLLMRTFALLQIDQTVVPVLIGRDRIYGGAGLIFESPNCMGIPYMNPGRPSIEIDPPSLLPLTAIGPPGQTVYVAIPGAAARPIVKKSVLEFGLRCRNETGNIPEATPTQPLIDLLTVFTPPFSLKAQ